MKSENANDIIKLQMQSITDLENKNEALKKDSKAIREENRLLIEEKKELQAHVNELEERNTELNETIKVYKKRADDYGY